MEKKVSVVNENRRKVSKMDNKKLSWAENMFLPWSSKTEINEKTIPESGTRSE